MKDRRELFRVDAEGKRGRACVCAAGGFSPIKFSTCRFMSPLGLSEVVNSQKTSTFVKSLEILISFGAVGREEEIGPADLTRERDALPLFMACLRHNKENRRNEKKQKNVHFRQLLRERRDSSLVES